MTDLAARLQGLESLVAKISLEKMLADNSTYSYTVYFDLFVHRL